MTECNQQIFEFQGLGGRKVQADFSGGFLSSDGGALLLCEMERSQRLCERLAGCFSDGRKPGLVEHELAVMLRQRVLGLALGYEDINDHERLRLDPLLAAVCGRADVLGAQRQREEDRDKALAGKSTLNRLELGAQHTDGRYKKIAAHPEKIAALLLERGVGAIARKSGCIVLDFDATDDPVHGDQEGKFFHGYYGHYCYLPLYCFCGDIPLWAQLRTSDRDASVGALEALQQVVAAIRQRFGKHTPIVVRGDSGFCREGLMAWIESQPNLHYCFGLARNRRLEAMLEPAWERVAGCLDEQGCGREFVELRYCTRQSWSRERRVVGKAELLGDKRNPRFIVTDLSGQESWATGLGQFGDGRALYEKFYCARGDMENRIKEQQLDLFADRTSTAYMASNQLRLWFSSFAYLLLGRLRAVALGGTRLAQATVGTIRLGLLKIAAQLTVSVRRIYVRLCSACPLQEIFAQAHARLRALGP